MPTALITGVSGQDGSYLADRLLVEGWVVHALVRSTRRTDEQDVSTRVTSHRGDLADPESLHRVIEESEPDFIFNLGGISSVAQSWDQPELTSTVTGHSVAVMLDSAWKLQERTGREVRFIQASSSEIFGAATAFPQDETTPIRPVSPYGAAKAYAHHLTGVYRSKDLFAATAILYNHESPRRPKAFVTRKITSGVAAIAAGRTNVLSLGNLDAIRDWGWAPDYVDAMLKIVSAPNPDDFVVATGIAHRVDEFVTAAFSSVGIEDWSSYVKIDEQFARPADAPEMIGDPTKISTLLGWTPQTDFPTLVRRMVEHDLTLVTAANP